MEDMPLGMLTRLRNRLQRDQATAADGPFALYSRARPEQEDLTEEESYTRPELAELLSAKLAVIPVGEIRAQVGEKPLILVINRSIFTLDVEEGKLVIRRPPGGAAGALFDALRGEGGGVVVSTATTNLERSIAQSGLLVSPGDNIWVHYLYVPEPTFDLFYNEFANPALWLMQHEMGDAILARPQARDWLRHPRDWISYHLPGVKMAAIHRIIFTSGLDRAYVEGYQRVNYQYAEAIMSAYGELPDARIMIHDYHFYLLPQYLRELGSTALLDHFIHIPWMSPHYFQRVMPEALRRSLVSSLLQNDILGFQVQRYCQDFMTAARALLGAEVDFENGTITYQGHTALVQPYPISVDVGQLRRTALAGEEGLTTLEYVQGLRRKIGQKLLIVRVERLDLSKGILEGFQALDLVLSRAPALRDQVHLLALLQLSRMDVPEYRNLLDQARDLIRELNARWTSGAAWDGIIETESDRDAYRRDLAEPAARAWPLIIADFTEKPYPEVVGAQIAADVGLINPLADGMNLVAKEFAVNNKPSFIREFNQRLRRNGFLAAGALPGVIVGSNRMGAFYELRDGLLAVDPRSPNETADALLRALRMQSEARGLAAKGRLSDRLPTPLRNLVQQRLPPEVLADRAAEQVSRNTITDWMDKILLDMELALDPDWQRVVSERGISQARGAIERGLTLADAFPSVVARKLADSQGATPANRRR